MRETGGCKATAPADLRFTLHTSRSVPFACGPGSLGAIVGGGWGQGKEKKPYLVSRVSYLGLRQAGGWRLEAIGHGARTSRFTLHTRFRSAWAEAHPTALHASDWSTHLRFYPIYAPTGLESMGLFPYFRRWTRRTSGVARSGVRVARSSGILRRATRSETERQRGSTPAAASTARPLRPDLRAAREGR